MNEMINDMDGHAAPPAGRAATKAAGRATAPLDAARNRAFHESKPVRFHRPADALSSTHHHPC